MKRPNANGDGKCLSFKWVEILNSLFTAQKSSGDYQNFNAFPSADESPV